MNEKIRIAIKIPFEIDSDNFSSLSKVINIPPKQKIRISIKTMIERNWEIILV